MVTSIILDGVWTTRKEDETIKQHIDRHQKLVKESNSK